MTTPLHHGQKDGRWCVRVAVALLLLHSARVTWALDSTIDSSNRLAYGANVGWIDWRADITNGAFVASTACSGSLYAANVGWIDLGDGKPANGVHYQNNSASDYGVNVLADGNLRGFAWGANVGWINFEATGNPRVDLASGHFSGYAYGANIGWISLSNAFARVQTGFVPKIPTGLWALVQPDGSIQLGWQDNSNNEENFILRRGTKPKGPYDLIATLGPNTTSYSDTGLAPSNYYYKVRSRNAVGPSRLSNKSIASILSGPIPSTAPAAPTGLFVSGAAKITVASLAWTDHANNEDGFKVFRSTDGVNYALVGSMGQEMNWFTDKWLAPNTTYYYKVRAYNRAADSADSDVTMLTTSSALGPVSTAGAESLSLTVVWAPDEAARLGLADDPQIQTAAGWLTSPVGTWEVTIAGAAAGRAFVTFTADQTLTGYGLDTASAEPFKLAGTWRLADGILEGAYLEERGGVVLLSHLSGWLDPAGLISASAESDTGVCLWLAIPAADYVELSGPWQVDWEAGLSGPWQVLAAPWQPGLFEFQGRVADDTGVAGWLLSGADDQVEGVVTGPRPEHFQAELIGPGRLRIILRPP